jgi:glycine/serine hydroxymethyltransferase
MERRIALNDNSLRKKSIVNCCEIGCNEKRNSLTSGIRIGTDEKFLIRVKREKGIKPVF